ncbi:PrgI family protein [Candidatus Gottesmanbacteria bacterium]|nr:PrgI family protein [Candidatus Gottesmanbacteria bacterium]
MEQHPVPQNVTTFQFRLIGDMTIKQFGYIAGGAIAAYICYKLPLPFFFTWPLTIASALLGFGLAFVPIEERPMDIWVLSFFKSIYSPTEYLWQKSKPIQEPQQQPAHQPTLINRAPSPSLFSIIHQLFSAAPPAPFAHSAAQQIPKRASAPHLRSSGISPFVPIIQPTQTKPPAPTQYDTILSGKRTPNPFGWILDFFGAKQKPTYVNSGLPDVFSKIPMSSVTGKRMDEPSGVATQTASPIANPAVIEAEQKTSALEDKLKSLQQELHGKTLTESRILELQQQLTEALQQKTTMENEIAAMRQQATKPLTGQTPVAQTAAPMPTASAQPTVRIINAEDAVKAGLPRLTTFPNVVTGIIKNHENELLAGVLITVRDVEGTPLRALKTNKLGQFAASTPLPNGTYLVEVEDPRNRYTFDRAQIQVSGTLVPTIEITAKSQRELSREKLAKEIFGGQL